MYELENVVLIAQTDKAILVRMTYETEDDIPDEFEDDVNQWWIPISWIESTDLEDIGDQGSVELPYWQAKQKCMPGAE